MVICSQCRGQERAAFDPRRFHLTLVSRLVRRDTGMAVQSTQLVDATSNYLASVTMESLCCNAQLHRGGRRIRTEAAFISIRIGCDRHDSGAHPLFSWTEWTQQTVILSLCITFASELRWNEENHSSRMDIAVTPAHSLSWSMIEWTLQEGRTVKFEH